jgi:hypothetical protein
MGIASLVFVSEGASRAAQTGEITSPLAHINDHTHFIKMSEAI